MNNFKNLSLSRKITVIILFALLITCIIAGVKENQKSSIKLGKYSGKNDFTKRWMEQDKDNAISIAASSGNLDLVKEALRENQNINKKNKFGNTPLLSACRSGHLDIVKYLVENGADINLKDKVGSSPVLNAASSGSIKIIDYLISKGANIKDKDNKGNNALLIAIYNPKFNSETLKYLIDKGLSINSKNYKGETPFLLAIRSTSRKQEYSILDLLLKNGADINAKGNQGENALMYAAETSQGFSPEKQTNSPIIEFLIKKGLKVDTKDYNGKTALMYAVESDNSPAIMSLLSHGANINAQDNQGKTALMYANSYTQAENLIANHINAKIKDKYGKTAIDYAKDKAKLNIVNLLQEPNAIQKLGKDQIICNSDDEVHFIGVYGASNGDMANHGKGKINVKVTIQNKPVVLLLSAYEPVEWNITKLPNSKIKKLILTGYYKQTFKGLNPNTPVVSTSHEEDRGNSTYFDDVPQSRNEVLELMDRIKDKLGVKPKTVQTESKGTYTEINGKNTITFNDYADNSNESSWLECKSGCDLTNNNFTLTQGSAISSKSHNSGKWYYEVTLKTSKLWLDRYDINIGVDYNRTNRSGFQEFFTYQLAGNNIVKSFKNNDTIGIVMDLDNSKLYIYRNGELIKNSPPRFDWWFELKPQRDYWAGLNIKATNTSLTANFGDSPFKYPTPKGYKPFNK